ncbi:MAG: hypothetical protein R3D98_13775 [Candidatus Krumholzibacteriia bacterium]
MAAVGLSLVAVDRLSRDLPALDRLRNIQPSEKTVILAANGDTLQEFYTQNRTVVPLERIPQHSRTPWSRSRTVASTTTTAST